MLELLLNNNMLHQYNYERRTSVHILYFVIPELSFLIELFELQELSRLKHICGNITYILFIFPMNFYRRKEPTITKCVRDCPTLLLHVAYFSQFVFIGKTLISFTCILYPLFNMYESHFVKF